jgi:hypothetical protein
VALGSSGPNQPQGEPLHSRRCLVRRHRHPYSGLRFPEHPRPTRPFARAPFRVISPLRSLLHQLFKDFPLTCPVSRPSLQPQSLGAAPSAPSLQIPPDHLPTTPAPLVSQSPLPHASSRNIWRGGCCQRLKRQRPRQSRHEMAPSAAHRTRNDPHARSVACCVCDCHSGAT